MLGISVHALQRERHLRSEDEAVGMTLSLNKSNFMSTAGKCICKLQCQRAHTHAHAKGVKYFFDIKIF